MATGDIWRIAMTGTLEGTEYVNVWHIRMKSEAGTPAGAVSVIKTNWYDLVKGSLVPAWNISLARSRRLSVPSLLDDTVASAVGSGGGEALPPQCAMVITLRTGIAGRSRRGRIYQGGFSESSQAAGVWSGAMVTAFQGYLDDLLANIGSGGASLDYEWGVWSRVLGGDDPGPYDLVAGFRPITAAVVRSTVFTQRRRVVGVGR